MQTLNLYSLIDLDAQIKKGIEKKLTLDGVGTVLRVYTGIDLSDADSVTIKIERPNGTFADWEAEIDEDNPYYMTYTIQEDDLISTEGEYFVVAEADFGGNLLHGDRTSFFTQERFPI